jgi:hypothetical protein
MQSEMYHTSLSWLDTCTSIKSGGVKLVLWPQTSPVSEMMRHASIFNLRVNCQPSHITGAHFQPHIRAIKPSCCIKMFETGKCFKADYGMREQTIDMTCISSAPRHVQEYNFTRVLNSIKYTHLHVSFSIQWTC